MHQNIFAPKQRSYGIVALPGKYPMVKYGRATLLQLQAIKKMMTTKRFFTLESISALIASRTRREMKYFYPIAIQMKVFKK